ncbi:hypothetical protein PR202_ga04741 [Eleusine coracana subsp. coracana]|uniref:PB1 domain-containing protein n=1 Tax=Eleusine coracana subsp. coracana TaxID=191504 RepID=A0AAV5BSU6_ELECO|nr:hypothetical protein QOZ80_5AG0372420 [Eleusine coracana subsp. coracana]GJM88653.1 hypothetical protein PR202_ga04741 [Eleusine coracana subsp. coracana]
MAEVEDAMAALTATTESEGATTDDDVHLSPTSVCRSDGGAGSERIKLLCSFGGRIIPRPNDGALKYIGGETRVLAVPRSIPFREMKKKVEEMFKTEVAAIKYQLLSLSEDLDVLVSVTCDDDLLHMLDEYDRLEAKRSPTTSPRFRLYIFAPQATTLPAAAALPASSRYAGGGFSRQYHPHHHHHHYQHNNHFQPGERYVATVPVTPSGSPRGFLAPSHGTMSAGNSPRAGSAAAAEPPVFESLVGGMQRVRSSPNLGSLADLAVAAQHMHPQHAADVGGYLGSSPGHAGGFGHHYQQHQYAPVHVPQHPAGRYVHRVGNYHAAPPMVPVPRPVSRGGPVTHGGEMMQTPKKSALVWD